MTLTDALIQLGNDEDLVEVREISRDKHILSRILTVPGGCIVGDVIGQCDGLGASVKSIIDRYGGNTPRALGVGADSVFYAVRRQKISTYLCHVYYEHGTGHARHEVKAANPNEAFRMLLSEIKDEVSPEDADDPRSVEERIESITIEAARPLNPGQHPDTPPLWYTVASWKAKRKVAIEWVSEPTDEDYKASEEVWAKAVAQAMSPPGMTAVVTGVTEFGVTGTLVPGGEQT